MISGGSNSQGKATSPREATLTSYSRHFEVAIISNITFFLMRPEHWVCVKFTLKSFQRLIQRAVSSEGFSRGKLLLIIAVMSPKAWKMQSKEDWDVIRGYYCRMEFWNMVYELGYFIEKTVILLYWFLRCMMKIYFKN